MARKNRQDIRNLLAQDQDTLRELVRIAVQELLEAEMTEHLGAQ